MIPIAVSTIRPADEYTRPYRFVLRWDKFNPATPYAVHMETNPATAGAAYHNGDYCSNSLEAFKRLKVRASLAGLEVVFDWDAVNTAKV
jgi:hypothetical protein